MNPIFLLGLVKIPVLWIFSFSVLISLRKSYVNIKKYI